MSKAIDIERLQRSLSALNTDINAKIIQLDDTVAAIDKTWSSSKLTGIFGPIQSSLNTITESLALLNQWSDDTDKRLEELEYSSGGSVSLASMFDIGLNDVYHISKDAQAATAIENGLNISGFRSAIGTSGVVWKTPTITVPTLNWSNDVDENYDFTSQGIVRVTFGEAGTISKTVTFKKPGPGKIYAVRGMNSAYIDTGIAGDYSYTMHAKGHTISGSPAVLIGAFSSTTQRTTLRILGSSNKMQHMWPGNSEITSSTSGIDANKMFEVTFNSSSISLNQGVNIYNANYNKTSSGSVGSNINLLGELGGSYYSGVLCYAEILDQNNNTLAYYAPYKLATEEIVIININSLTAQQIYDIVENGDAAEMASNILRPVNGYLVEVTLEDDALL